MNCVWHYMNVPSLHGLKQAPIFAGAVTPCLLGSSYLDQKSTGNQLVKSPYVPYGKHMCFLPQIHCCSSSFHKKKNRRVNWPWVRPKSPPADQLGAHLRQCSQTSVIALYCSSCLVSRNWPGLASWVMIILNTLGIYSLTSIRSSISGKNIYIYIYYIYIIYIYIYHLFFSSWCFAPTNQPHIATFISDIPRVAVMVKPAKSIVNITEFRHPWWKKHLI